MLQPPCGVRLDLRQAQLAAPQVTLTEVSLVGEARVKVPWWYALRYQDQYWVNFIRGSSAGYAHYPKITSSQTAKYSFTVNVK